jgi:hypothetical protein
MGNSTPTPLIMFTTMHRLPHELVEYVLDYLPGDNVSLQACALTHRSWTPAAHARLCRDVSLQSGTTARHLARALERTPHLAQHIRALSASALTQPCPLSLLAAHLPQLRVLTLDMWGASVDPATSCSPWANAHAQLANLRELHLSHATFATFAGFVAFVEGFPQLKSLRCEQVHWLRGGEGEEFASEIALEEIEFREPAARRWAMGPELLRWVQRTHTLTTLRHLSLEVRNMDTLGALQDLLRGGAPALRELDLDLGDADASGKQGAS